MNIINFISKKGNGGMCDRFVGIVSSFIIAKKFNLNFEIYWDIQNINNFFKNVNYYNEQLDMLKYRFIDDKKIKKVKDFFERKNFNKSFSIESNMNWHQLLYQDMDEFAIETRNTYNLLLENILGIEKKFLDSVLSKYNDIQTRVGIQIRTGDKFFKEDGIEYISPSNYNLVCINIIEYLQQNNYKKIFLTADNPNIIEIFKKNLPNDIDLLLTQNENIHIDKIQNCELENFKNLFEEFYLLSCCEKIIGMAKYSNFSLTASLINNKPLVVVDNFGKIVELKEQYELVSKNIL